MSLSKNDILIGKMMEYYKGDPKRIQHFLKVYSLSSIIGRGENLAEKEQFILETASITHDIGIKVSEEKYNSSNGKYQELEGPAIAIELLKGLDYAQDIIERVCYLIGNHHTYSNIMEIDYRILVEADFLVNMYEDQMSQENIEKVYHKIFRTNAGKKLCREMFGLCVEGNMR